MNKTLKHFLLLSAIVPATFLVVMCFAVIATLISRLSFGPEAVAYLATSILGILGYTGLILLLINPPGSGEKSLLCLLASGVTSLVLFVAASGPRAWKWIFTVEEPGEWLLLVWPTVVTILFITGLVKRLASKTPKADG